MVNRYALKTNGSISVMPYFMTGALIPQMTATESRLKSAQNREEFELGVGLVTAPCRFCWLRSVEMILEASPELTTKS